MERSSNRQPRSGFTLVEMLLYVTLFAITMGTIASMYANNLATDQLARKEQDLNESRNAITSRIRELVESAGEIASPASGSSDDLVVGGNGIADGPVSISATDGILFMDTALEAPAALTPADIMVTNFLASRVAGSPPGIRVTMDLTVYAGTTAITDSVDLFVTLRYE